MDSSDIVHQGWLIKSPPLERQTNAFFKARWRRRWFVLVSGRDPGSYLLNYYTDNSRRRLKGTIFLEECEQVDSGLSLENKYEFTFNIKTPKRVYYLASDSFEDMNTWVKYVCNACGLKASNEQDPSTTSSFSLLSKTSSISSPSISSPYILMSECISGPPITGAYVNGGRSSSEGDSRRGEHIHYDEEEGDDSVFEAPSPTRTLPSRPPKPPHLSTVKELIKNVPPDVSRDLKPGRSKSDSIHNLCSRFMTMGPSVPRTLKPKGPSTSSLTMPRTWAHHSADETSNSESCSRRNSSQEEQIYYYISTLGSTDKYPPMMIPAESFETKV
ncbi:DOS [Lepeophtheirus salmonis]|uniref:DOS n=1 Tax=Lepeophtheirus salmonis TaxID=72036 RepID=A0A7R8CV22_LEPSM|nr:DOS [Lepeophtheirus salmonis]CAF2939745.1 DOS [Lepeophtheirus salmonis]